MSPPNGFNLEVSKITLAGKQLMIRFYPFRGLEGHTHGDLPWAWCDEGLDDQVGELVGKLICKSLHTERNLL